MKKFRLDKNAVFSLAFSLLSVVFLLLVWLIAYYGVRNEYVLPSIGATFAEAGKLLANGKFWAAFINTLLRTFGAFAFSLAAGTLLATTALSHGGVRAFLSPIVSILRTVPTMAIVLVLLLWTTPAFAPVIVSVLVLFPAVYAATLSSLDDVKTRYGETARAYRVSLGKQIFKMYLPLAAPPVLKQAGSIFSMGLKITVSGEVLASAARSLGGLMQEAKFMPWKMPELLALTILTVLLGFALEGLCLLAYKLIVRWKT